MMTLCEIHPVSQDSRPSQKKGHCGRSGAVLSESRQSEAQTLEVSKQLRVIAGRIHPRPEFPQGPTSRPGILAGNFSVLAWVLYSRQETMEVIPPRVLPQARDNWREVSREPQRFNIPTPRSPLIITYLGLQRGQTHEPSTRRKALRDRLLGVIR